MVLQALGEDGLDAGGDLRDQHGVRGVRLRRLERVPDRDDPPVDDLHQVDEQAEQRRDRDHHDDAEDVRRQPQVVLGRGHGQRVVHRYPPSLARPRCRPPMMTVAYSIVVRSAPSGAVLWTASVSASLIFGASSPIWRASTRIGTTSATTTRTTTMPIV